MAIAAFEGWNDAAEAASGVVNHPGIAWESTPIAAIDPDDFYDFQVNRPVIEVVARKTERLVWPTTRLSLARAGDHEAAAEYLALAAAMRPDRKHYTDALRQVRATLKFRRQAQ